MKTVILAVLLVFAAAIPSLAGETVSVTRSATNEGDIQSVLDRLRTTSGLYGADSSEMNSFVNMVNTPALTQVVDRMKNELLEQGGSEDLTMAEVSAFVQRNLTQQDASSILGMSVSSHDFQRGLQAGGDSQNLDMLIQMLQR